MTRRSAVVVSGLILFACSSCATRILDKNGVTVADIANGPQERIQPFPETVKLLESLGSRITTAAFRAETRAAVRRSPAKLSCSAEQ